jgi:multidrug efflux pump subunit AcrA (membrane-fusion protein)
MLRAIVSLVAVAALGLHAAAQEKYPPSNVPNCVVAPAELADLPPLEAGVIREVAVIYGQQVTAQQLLIQLDDSKVFQEQKVAEAKFTAAAPKAKDDVNIRYAVEAAKVAEAAFRVNDEANRKVPGSVPLEKLRELELEWTKNKLGIEKSKLEQIVAQHEALVAKAELEAAKVTVSRHKLLSPIAGEVYKIDAHNGEAVQPNLAAIHIVNLDRLWVEGRVPASRFARAELKGQQATVDVVITGGEKVSLPGEVDFVNPQTESGGSYIVRVKVKNRRAGDDWVLHPGMTAEMNIQLRK